MRHISIVGIPILITLGCSQSTAPAATQSSGRGLCPTIICNASFLPNRAWDSDETTVLRGDREEYRATDGVGQFAGGFFGSSLATHLANSDSRVVIRIEEGLATIYTATLTPPLSRKVAFQVDMTSLSTGNYVARIRLQSSNGATTHAQTTYAFERTSGTDVTTPFPSQGVAIHPHNQNVHENGAWPVSTGVPMPFGALEEDDLSRLVLEEDGEPVRAHFSVRAHWSPRGPVKWLGLDFLARWDEGQARDYVLYLRTTTATIAGPAVSVTTGSGSFQIENGELWLTFSTSSFGGLSVAYDADDDGLYESHEVVSRDKGGPYVVDENGDVYSAHTSTDTTVVVEESSPYKAVVRATGTYMTAGGDTLCRFIVRMTVVAGQPWVDVQHRTLITYTTTSAKRLRDVGFVVVPISDVESATWTFGSPEPLGDISGTDENAFVHQESADFFHVDDSSGTVANGERAFGWLSYLVDEEDHPRTTIMMRDFYEKYPKELEVTSHNPITGEEGDPRLVAHFWPKHGHAVFMSDVLSQAEIYKFRWAHEGSELSLAVPQDYLDALANFTDDGDGELTGAAAANGQGLAISNEFAVHFAHHGSSLSEISAQAALYDLTPHALASPEWNASSGALGVMSAAPSNTSASREERAVELAYPQYKRAIIDEGGEYGMWIYGGIHNNWDPRLHVPEIHRVWQNSHYQNVWTALMLYYRSNRAADYDFARINSEHYLNIGTNNWDGGPGRQAGRMYHCKGFVPWGGAGDMQLGYGGHFINPSAHLLRYYLFGDRHALDMYRAWASIVTVYGNARTENNGTSCASYEDSSYREVLTSLGEVTDLYTATWDPEVLLQLNVLDHELATTPFECSADPSRHPVWNQQWYTRYHDLTRADWVVNRLTAWATIYDNPSVAAFLSRATGDPNHLARESLHADFYDTARILYDQPGDRYHGYGPWSAALGSRHLQHTPYFLEALDRASMTLDRGSRPVSYPNAMYSLSLPTYLGNLVPHTLHAYRGWAPDSQYVYIKSGDPGDTWNIRMEPLAGHDLTQGTAVTIMSPRATPPLPRWQTAPWSTVVDYFAADALQTVRFTWDPNIAATYPFPWQSDNLASASGLHRFEAATPGAMSFVAPYGRGTIDGAEALMIRRWTFQDGNGYNPTHYYAVGRQLLWIQAFRPNPGVSTMNLQFMGGRGKLNSPVYSIAAKPAFVQIEDDKGNVIFHDDIFEYGSHRTTTATLSTVLDGNGRPPKYRLYTSSTHGPFITITHGTAEMLVSLEADDLDEIYDEFAPAPTCSMPSNYYPINRDKDSGIYDTGPRDGGYPDACPTD